jgi:putative DNA primase/helicase
LRRGHEGYVEASPSGTGVHIIVEGTARGGRARKKVRLEGEAVGEIEMYGQGRFFTITGEPL